MQTLKNTNRDLDLPRKATEVRAKGRSIYTIEGRRKESGIRDKQ